MYLHRLEFAGIGSFPGRHVIDFAALSVGGLFLLEGPTGSGKSTIIDAVTFALYGQVAGREATADRLRSSFCSDDEESYVELTFETASGIWRIWRSPERMRPKKRGEGLTKQQSAAKLWRLTQLDAADHAADQVGDFVSNRIDEVAAEVQRGIGLTKEQFVQTVVLPQGEFAAFLRADPEKRGELLQRIFGTEIYQRLEEELDERRRAAARAVDTGRQDLAAGIQRFATAAHLEEAARDDLLATLTNLGEHGEHLTQALQAHTAALATELAQASLIKAKAQASADAAATAHATAKTTHDLLTRRAQLRARKAELDADLPAHQTRTQQLTKAKAAAAITPTLTTHQNRQADLADLTVAVAEQHRGLTELGVNLAQPTELTVAEVTAELSQRRIRASQVEQLLVQTTQLQDAQQELQQRQTALAAQNEELAELATQLEALPAQLQEKQDAHQAAQNLATRKEALEAKAQAVGELLAAATQVADLQAQISTAETDLTDATAASTSANLKLAELRQRRINEIAGELAQDLAAGEHCPVCGATEHPHLAELGADHVSVEQVEAAEQQFNLATQTQQTQASRLTELRTKLSVHQATLGSRTLTQVQAESRAVQSEFEQAKAAEKTANDLAGQVAALTQTLQTITEAHTAKDQELRTATTQLEGTQATWRSDLEKLANQLQLPPRSDLPTVTAHASNLASSLSQQLDVLQILHTALAELTTTKRLAEAAESALQEALARHGFTNLAEYRAALLADSELTTLEEQIAAEQRLRTQVEVGLAAPELVDLPEDAELDETGIGQKYQAWEAAQGELDAANQRHTRARDTHAQAAREAKDLATSLTKHHKTQADHAPVLRLADLANARDSHNPLGLSLRTYVLMRRFEDVVEAANSRLHLMSGGRLELRRSSEREVKRVKRTGLALRIWHHDTNTELLPGSLSGGETFYVSLCLALGLADVVKAEAGGVELGTLFVDEGFGSLDPETLEAVITELHRLHASGRVVGIVSHVEGLKTAIAERIAVRRTADGNSTLRIHA